MRLGVALSHRRDWLTRIFPSLASTETQLSDCTVWRSWQQFSHPEHFRQMYVARV